MNIKSGSAILFLYEGDTEGGFYDRLFDLLKIRGNVQLRKKCLHGVYNINKKVINQIDNYLDNDKNKHVKQLTVFVAFDREGNRTNPSRLDKMLIIKTLGNSRLKGIHEIVATQMLESWFFIDIEGIFKFIKAPSNKRNASKYSAHENFDHKDLDTLFKQHGKRYYKGDRTQNLIENLDVLKIYNQSDDLHNGMNKVLQLAGIPIKKRKK